MQEQLEFSEIYSYLAESGVNCSNIAEKMGIPRQSLRNFLIGDVSTETHFKYTPQFKAELVVLVKSIINVIETLEREGKNNE